MNIIYNFEYIVNSILIVYIEYIIIIFTFDNYNRIKF